METAGVLPVVTRVKPHASQVMEKRAGSMRTVQEVWARTMAAAKSLTGGERKGGGEGVNCTKE